MSRAALLALTLCQTLLSCAPVAAVGPAVYNVEWLTPTAEPGKNEAGQPTYAGGMPIGNGDAAVLAWPNVTSGGVQFYVSKADAMALDTTLFKLGMVAVTLSPNPFESGSYFNQTLDLASATITVLAGGSSVDTYAVAFTLWVDAEANALYVQAQSRDAANVFSVGVELWSVRPSQPFQYGFSFGCANGQSAPDTIVDPLPAAFSPGTLISYHRNDVTTDGPDYFAETLTQQGLAQLIPQLTPHPWTNRTFGLAIDGSCGGSQTPLKRTSPTTLASGTPAAECTVRVVMLTNQTASADLWLAQLAALVAAQDDRGTTSALQSHLDWWDAFWARSYIAINSSQTGGNGFAVSQQYAVTRYVQAIQARTAWPIKFNGMLFVANMPDGGTAPDYRDWGASNWWQNTRLPYWSMLPAGDVDTFQTVLDYYVAMLPFAQARTAAYFNHSGIFFTETKTLFGAFAPADYGCGRQPGSYPVWLEQNEYIHLDYGGNAGGTEAGLMALDHYLYTGDAEALERYLPIATLTVDFFRQHYPQRTGPDNNTYVFFPTQALETYWCDWPATPENCCVDDTPSVSAMHSLLDKLLALPPQFSTPDQRAAWAQFQSQLPPVPVSADGSRLLAARVLSPGTHNDETPELYSVHPFRLFTVGRALTANVSLNAAITAFEQDPNAHSNSGWNQGIMDAALLGMTSTAAAMVVERALQSPAPGYRFQGFMPHMQDYEPSADHLANHNSALNWMLLQPADDGFVTGTFVVFPAWPCDWDVAFKLSAPLNTTVEIDYAGGKLLSLVVVPPARRTALIFANCVSN